MKRTLTLLMLLATAACDRGTEEVPPEVRAARQQARRLACLSAEMARTADEDLRTLEETLASTGTGPASAPARIAAQAAISYADVYRQHALLREAAAAQADSALSRSATSADSLRHERQAEQFVISAPEPGTIEANVIIDYERKIAVLLADQDHPCNWDLEDEPVNR